MRILPAAILAVLVLAACSSNSGEASRDGGDDEAAAAPESRIERCVERFVSRIRFEQFPRLTREQARRYAERAYCARFEERGWVYEDGTLSIDVYADDGSEECAVAEPGKPARTLSCDELAERVEVLDCAILHLVRRSEVQRYLAELKRRHDVVECDDGTPLDELGAG